MRDKQQHLLCKINREWLKIIYGVLIKYDWCIVGYNTNLC